MSSAIRLRVSINGTVQGVGFRPFLFRAANSLGLTGFTQNTADGALAEVEGSEPGCLRFVEMISEQPPAAARVCEVKVEHITPRGDTEFTIIPSNGGAAQTFVSPDIGMCDECLADIVRDSDRHFLYLFTNCTNCGPRFSIIDSVPYDRMNTSMAQFAMCGECAKEYGNPENRRFHAQPVACPDCGPQAVLIESGAEYRGENLFAEFDRLINSGKTVAVKGIGGYHLVCSAFDNSASERLRKAKKRFDKPMAVMARDIETVRRLCEVNTFEERLLTSAEKPIVLLKRVRECAIAPDVYRDSDRLGVMLPYTPLHFLLMRNHDSLVMTSGNYSDSPMIFDDETAQKILPGLADAVLTHNRLIRRRVDDSVVFAGETGVHLIRRARGYVPEPIHVGGKASVLAFGAQQKNTFTLTKNGYAFLSGHIGDLDYPQAEAFLKSEAEAFCGLFAAKPELAVCDLHPDYVSSRLARESGLPVVTVQHHRAHFASVLAERAEKASDIAGFVFDGSGLGDDGTLWGGELLFGGIGGSRRVGHLRTFSLPGGEKAVREPWRCACSLISDTLGEQRAISFFESADFDAQRLLAAVKAGINSPTTSSVGRLFDAISAIAGLCFISSYEGQAAVRLESAADMSESGSYCFGIYDLDGQTVFDYRPVIEQAVSDRLAGTAPGVISARFHRALAELTVRLAERLDTRKIALSGGVFQNALLLNTTVRLLSDKGFTVLTNNTVPTNDGGISFGQAASAIFETK